MAETAERTEIPRAEWATFCESFGREHNAWLITVRVADTERLQRERDAAVRDAAMPLRGLPLKALRWRDGALEVVAGAGAQERSIRVDDVRRILDERGAGGDAGLAAESNDGTTTLVAFRVAARPEALDGLAEV